MRQRTENCFTFKRSIELKIQFHCYYPAETIHSNLKKNKSIQLCARDLANDASGVCCSIPSRCHLTHSTTHSNNPNVSVFPQLCVRAIKLNLVCDCVVADKQNGNIAFQQRQRVREEKWKILTNGNLSHQTRKTSILLMLILFK